MYNIYSQEQFDPFILLERFDHVPAEAIAHIMYENRQISSKIIYLLGIATQDTPIIDDLYAVLEYILGWSLFVLKSLSDIGLGAPSTGNCWPCLR